MLDFVLHKTGVVLQFLIIILAFVYYKKLQKFGNIFLIAIILTFITEVIAGIMRFNNPSYSTQMIYSIGVFIFVFFTFFLYFYKMMDFKKLKKLQLYIIIIFIINTMYFVFFDKEFLKGFSVINYFINVILLLFSVAIFFYQTFNSERILSLKTYFPFWFAISLVVIYAGLLPVVVISSRASFFVNPEVFRFVVFLINLIGYSIMLFGIFFSAKQLKTKV